MGEQNGKEGRKEGRKDGMEYDHTQGEEQERGREEKDSNVESLPSSNGGVMNIIINCKLESRAG